MIEVIIEMTQKAKILIVDDDYDYVEITKTILKNEAFEVEAVYNKRAAMEMIPRLMPDLIILDIIMERLNDGFKICYELKHKKEFKDIPVLVISSVSKKTGLSFSPDTDGEYFEKVHPRD